MKENPANAIKDTMWKFLMDGGQKANIPVLKEYVYDLIGMTTQKTAGQRQTAKKDIPWEELNMTLMSIVIEATALVLSGELDKLEKQDCQQCEYDGRCSVQDFAKDITGCSGHSKPKATVRQGIKSQRNMEGEEKP